MYLIYTLQLTERGLCSLFAKFLLTTFINFFNLNIRVYKLLIDLGKCFWKPDYFSTTFIVHSAFNYALCIECVNTFRKSLLGLHIYNQIHYQLYSKRKNKLHPV